MDELEKVARQVRKDIVEMIYVAGSGHPGGSLSAVELLVSLYFGILEKDDKFFLSNGHICPAWFSVMAEKGLIDKDLLTKYAELGSPLQGHPERKFLSLVENTSGPLGLGLAQAAGYAAVTKTRAYCMLSDAEHDEGNTWEAIAFANKYKLANLTAIVDRNGIQIEGTTEEIMPLGSLASKYQSFGWEVIEVNGHDFNQIFEAFEKAKTFADNPCVIIANTTFGKGVSFMEGNPDWHARAPGKDEFSRAMKELENF